MSLKAFHLVFIVASILMCAGTAAWSLMNYRAPQGNQWDLALGIGSIVAALGLIVYERYFLKKFKNVSYV
jgi:type III secretory pathway component EscT